jgi:hypothetical protein
MEAKEPTIFFVIESSELEEPFYYKKFKIAERVLSEMGYSLDPKSSKDYKNVQLGLGGAKAVYIKESTKGKRMLINRNPPEVNKAYISYQMFED